MKRNCPYCKSLLHDNCYLKDNGTSTLSYLELIVKDADLKKKNYELKTSYCPTCGHVETWIELSVKAEKK